MSGIVVEANENIHLKNNQEKYNIKLGIREWKRYPEYKDSGVEWIGEIPKEWNIKPLKQVTEFISRGNAPDYVDQSSIKVINQACIYWDGLNLENVKYQREVNVSGWKGLLQKGDLLINSTGTGTLGRASIFDQTGTFIVDSHVTIVRSIRNDILKNYLFYLIQTPIYQGFIYSALISGSTNQIELSREGLRITPIIIPSLSEQKNIVTLLDHETSKIDTLIEKKQFFIKLLEEKRYVLISHAVTKGLDPEVKMKDSGVKWIGKVPEHWEIKRLKRIIVEKLKYGANESAELEDQELPRYIRITDFDEKGNLREDTFKSLPLEIAEDYLLNQGDILFARSGATVGKTFQFKNYSRKACFAGYLIKASPDEKKMLSDYLYLYTKSNSYDQWKNSIFIQATIQNIGADKYQSLELTAPPLSEQKFIVDYLSRKTEKIDTFINKINAQIEKLKEYRTALISAAVTGKIDVQEEIA